MKYLILVCFIGCHVLQAQSELDEMTTELSEKYLMKTKELKKLESIRVKAPDQNSESEEWKRRYQKWIGNAMDSINIERLLLSELGFNSRRDEKTYPGFSQNYLIYRIDILTKKGLINEQNEIVLRNIVAGELDNNEQIENEVLRIESSLKSLMNNRKSDYSVVEKISSFIGLHSSEIDPTNLLEIIEAVRNYTPNDRSAFATYMQKMDFNYEDVARSVSFPSLNPQSICSRLFIGRLHSSSTLLHFIDDDFILFDEFLKNETIRNVLLTRMLLLSWQEQELNDLDNKNYVQEWERTLHEKPSTLFSHLEYSLNHCLNKFWLMDTSRGSFDQLLVLAYNDVYFNFNASTSVKFKRAEVRIDFAQFDLTDSERSILNGLLAEDKMVTKNLLVTIITEDNLKSSNWNLEFKLACYVALYYKSLDQTRDWNNDQIVSNPFERTDKILRMVTKIPQEEWELCKAKCQLVLTNDGYLGKTYFIYTNGQNVFSVYPQIKISTEQQLERVLRDHIPLGEFSHYFRMVIQVSETNQNSNDTPIAARNKDRPPNETDLGGGRKIYPPPPAQILPQKERAVAVADIADFPDVEASFPGGNAEMKRWIMANLQYPEISRELGDQGRVYVVFVVEIDGSISGVDVMQGGLTAELNKEAIRVVQSMPKWSPGEVKGVPIRTRCRLPIPFTLR